MQTSPPSVGNSVILNPLTFNVNNIAYTTGFINLKSVEPSLGIPTGYTFTDPGCAYYFPVFGNSNSYFDSRKFTGDDSLVLKNHNLGINNPNPVYNVDIGGTLGALSGNILNLYVSNLYGNSSLTFDYASGVNFNCDVFFNKNLYVQNITAQYLSTYGLFAYNLTYKNKIINVYQLNSANVASDATINGNLTASNIVVLDSLKTSSITAVNANFNYLSANKILINQNLNADTIYANKIYGKVDIDQSSALTYNNNNQLSFIANKNYYFAIRPSDSYSTDDINVARTTTSPSDNGQYEDSVVYRPYFKNLQAVIDYVYTNGIFGNNLVIYLDEDVIAGEDKTNDYTPDQSGQYSGCTFTGNTSSAFFSTEYIQAYQPDLYNSGIRGGDFIWNRDNKSDINGNFNYVNLYPLKFNNITIQARYEIGTSIYNPPHLYYSTHRAYDKEPKKITFRTYVCSNSAIPFGSFANTNASTWTKVFTKSYVYGRQVQFNHLPQTNLYITNICFEFDSNSPESTALVFNNGTTSIANTTIALLGTGVYSYGAINITTESAFVFICGGYLLDPFFLTSATWGKWNDYGFDTGFYYPGYGVALVGNPNTATRPTIINKTEADPFVGFFNLEDGGKLSILDYGTNGRRYGNHSFLLNSLILDGNFYVNSFFTIGNKSDVITEGMMFKTNTFNINSAYIIYNNIKVNDLFTIQISEYALNFKYINFTGCFASFRPSSQRFTYWTFYKDTASPGDYYNTYLNIYNKYVDPYYTFNIKTNTIDLTNAVNSLGHVNYLANGIFNNNGVIKEYVGISDILDFQSLWTFPSPTGNNSSLLNFYLPSIR
jgi:hypothetical protein